MNVRGRRESEPVDAWDSFRYWFPFGIGCRNSQRLSDSAVSGSRDSVKREGHIYIDCIEIKWASRGTRALSISPRKSARRNYVEYLRSISKLTSLFFYNLFLWSRDDINSMINRWNKTQSNIANHRSETSRRIKTIHCFLIASESRVGLAYTKPRNEDERGRELSSGRR